MILAGPRPSILVAGHVTVDRYGADDAPGGSAYYAGHAYRGLGARVHVVTAAGPDLPLRALDGLDVTVARCARTTTFSNVHHADGPRTQRVEACAPPLDPGAVAPSWAHPDVLHLAPVLGEIDLRRWLRAVRAGFVGIGVQGWVRTLAPDGSVRPGRWDFDARDLSGVDAASIGDDDVAGQEDVVERLAAAVPIVAFTHGKRGCELLLSGRSVRVGCYRTEEVEPTGAGDVFAAGFFLALARGADPADAARLGAAAASIVVEARAGEALQRIPEAWSRVADVG